MHFEVTLRLTHYEGFPGNDIEVNDIWKVTVKAPNKKLAMRLAEKKVYEYMKGNFPNPVGAVAVDCEYTKNPTPSFLAGF